MRIAANSVQAVFAAAIVTAWPGASLRAGEDGLLLRESFVPGYQYHVSTRTELSGSLSLPPDQVQPKGPKTVSIVGKSAIEYDEKVLSVTSSQTVDKTARIYRRLDFDRTVGDRPQGNSLRHSVRRLVLLRLQTSEVPFSPDGSLTWAEIDLVSKDVFTPALNGLLPPDAVRVGQKWPATAAAIQELTDLEQIEEGGLQCQLDELTTVQERPVARVGFKGSVRGVNEDGPNRQTLEGYLFFDLKSKHVSYVSLNGTSQLLDKSGKTMGTIEGRFVLTRQANANAPELADAALRGISLEPNSDNTQLLYDNPDLGIRFQHPRRWHVAGVRGSQIAIDDPNGNGFLLTVEPLNRVPTSTEFYRESRNVLDQQKAKISKVDPPRRLPDPAQDLDSFGFDAELAGQRVLMDYYVLRQAAGGATVAARLLPQDAVALRQDLSRLIRSVRLSAPQNPVRNPADPKMGK